MRRRAGTVVVFLFLGAIVNFAVAWGVAAWGRPNGTMLHPGETEMATGRCIVGQCEWVMVVHNRTFWAFASVHHFSDAGVADAIVGLWKKSFEDMLNSSYRTRDVPPKWVQHFCDASTGHTCASSMSAGWPALSLTAHFRIVSGTPVPPPMIEVSNGHFAAQPAAGDWIFAPPATLPLRPIWPGFAINTIFYAAILRMLFVMPGTIRRRRRLKRGLCPKCKYPIGTSSVCTECGKPLSVRSVEPS